MPKTKNTTKTKKSGKLGNGDSPIIIADSSSAGGSKLAISPGVYISHSNFRGTIEVTVSDPGYHAVSVQPPSPALPIPLNVPWILTVNNSVHISSVTDGVVHIHFNSVSYDVGVYETNPAFVIAGQALKSVTLLNHVLPNANLTNILVFQGSPASAMVLINFAASAKKSRKKR